MNNVVLFDGVCSLCNASVDFIMRHEKGDTLKFASLQSEIGKRIVADSTMKYVPDSILFYTDGVLLTESSAVLRIAKFLKAPISYAVVFRFLPLFVRDGVYRCIARNRYRWFGKRDTCRVPTLTEQKKLLG